MKIIILFFGIYREITGKREEIIETGRSITVEELLEMLDERYENFSRLESSTKVAVNQAFVDRNHPLQPEDTVAFIPPLGGGGGVAMAKIARELAKRHKVDVLTSRYRGYNIDSLSVAETLDPSVSRMTLSLHGDEWVIEQAVKQLHPLIDVIKVVDLTDEEHIGREMVFVRVNAEPANRAEILRINEIFRGRIVDVTPSSYTLEITGEQKKLAAVLDLLQPFGIQEIVRSGTLAMARGSKTLPKRDEARLRVAGRKQAVGE